MPRKRTCVSITVAKVYQEGEFLFRIIRVDLGKPVPYRRSWQLTNRKKSKLVVRHGRGTRRVYASGEDADLRLTASIFHPNRYSNFSTSGPSNSFCSTNTFFCRCLSILSAIISCRSLISSESRDVCCSVARLTATWSSWLYRWRLEWCSRSSSSSTSTVGSRIRYVRFC